MPLPAGCLTRICRSFSSSTAAWKVWRVVRWRPRHATYRMVDAAVGGHQQHRQARPPFANRPEQCKAIHRVHLVVGDHGRHAAFGKYPERIAAVGGGNDVVACQVQRLGERIPECVVVLDEKDRCIGHAACSVSAPARRRRLAVTGIDSTKHAPGAAESTTRMLPPWARRPSGRRRGPGRCPSLRDVKKGSKIRSRSGAGTPGPLSVTVISADRPRPQDRDTHAGAAALPPAVRC